MAKVSVIIPVHDMQEYIDKCMESVMNQTLSDLEIILMENASTDDSLAMCMEYAAKDSRVKVMHLDVGDLSTARNSGIAVATSEYVAFLDSDDTADPQMYESLYSFAMENDLDLVYCNHVQTFDDLPPKYKFPETGARTVFEPAALLLKNLMQKIPVSSCPMLVRRCLFDSLSFPVFTYFEDRAFTYKLINACRKVGYIDKAYYRYYQRPGSIVHTFKWKHYYDYAKAERDRLAFLVSSTSYTEEEKMDASRIIAEGFLSKLRRTFHKAKTESEKKLTKELIKDIALIPPGCKIRMKHRYYCFILKLKYRWI